MAAGALLVAGPVVVAAVSLWRYDRETRSELGKVPGTTWMRRAVVSADDTRTGKRALQ
jgi:hypothetical protein